MIDAKCLESNWIFAVSKQKKADPILVEKVIQALWLLEGLVLSGLPFTFKGGTALMLKLGSTRRLSIDIDIVLPKKDDSLSVLLKRVGQERGFSRVEEQVRKSRLSIEKAHYKFYYKPVAQKAGQAYVMLDILAGDSGYHQVEELALESSFLSLSGKPTFLAVPSFEDFMGDKLTAFAPETTGIPYLKNGQSASMEIIKQLYDLSCLFDQVNDLGVVYKTFEQIAKTELSYRQLDKNPHHVLEDTYQAALCLSSYGRLGNANYEALLSGVKRIQPYIFSELYNMDKAISQASRIAHLTRLLLLQKKAITRFESAHQIKDWNIADQSMNKLNKLKKINPEAYYYWYRSLELTPK